MKSWKNRRNTYWILIATVFGLIFSGNQTNHYKNFIGLIFCWVLYLFCFVRNNQEVEKQEQREKEEHQKIVKKELEKKEKEQIEKEKKAQEFYELVEYPKIINYIMAKYNKDWEQNLYPQNSRIHIAFIKKQIEADIEHEKIDIRNYKNAIEKIEDLKRKTRFHYKCEELDRKINSYQIAINYCQENIKNIPKKYEHRIAFYQNEIERYKDQCRKYEQKANDLLYNSPQEIIKAVDCHLKKIEEVKQRPLKSYYDDRDIWIKREEEKLPYLLQAKLDATNRIKEMEK
ncbi:MAG TPA: hypothetical protein HA355_03620 [Methanosphaera sp.]|nr:hypothetical protein [Methanosphaera sp.]